MGGAELINLNNTLNSNGFLNLSMPSKVTFSSEFAQIYPNPNPIGIAYIDDFESSKQYTSIPVSHSAWKLSSSPSIVNNYDCLETENQNQTYCENDLKRIVEYHEIIKSINEKF